MTHKWIQREYPQCEIDGKAPCCQDSVSNDQSPIVLPAVIAIAGLGLGCASLLLTRKMLPVVQIGATAALALAGIGGACFLVALDAGKSAGDPGCSDADSEGNAQESAVPDVADASQEATEAEQSGQAPEPTPTVSKRTSIYGIVDEPAPDPISDKPAAEPKNHVPAGNGEKFANGDVKSFTAEFMPVITSDEEAEQEVAELPEDLREALDDLAFELEDAINAHASEELNLDEFAQDAVDDSDQSAKSTGQEISPERSELIQNYRAIFNNRK